MTTLQAIIIAIVQGATELFPVSSLGHAVILPALLHWDLDTKSEAFLPFLVMLHVGTAVALLLYFWKDWLGLISGVLGLGSTGSKKANRRLLVMMIAATIPAVLLGFALEKFFKGLFGAPVIAAAFLIVNGALLLLGERLRKQAGNREMAEMTLADALMVGVWQCGALIPGISRSGATIVGGLLQGMTHAAAARFSFLIATPIILGATVLEVPKLLHASVPPEVLQLSYLSALIAGVTAFASTAFLMKYFDEHENWALNPFAYYCFIFGLGALGLILL